MIKDYHWMMNGDDNWWAMEIVIKSISERERERKSNLY